MKINANKIIIFLISLFFVFSAEKIHAENSNTFPVDEAGISAYLKIDNPGSNELTKALYYRKETIEDQQETHIIISFEIDITIEAETSNNETINEKIYPLIYLNTDGWMVAYFPKQEESIKIMQWTNYSPGNLETNVLKEALVKMTDNIDATYSNPIKYYHFSYPEANRITLVAETIHYPSDSRNSFSVTVPGIIHEVSYSFFHSFQIGHPASDCSLKLLVDDVEADSFFHNNCHGKGLKYESYQSDSFKNNVAHLVSLTASADNDHPAFNGGAATIFIYQVDH